MPPPTAPSEIRSHRRKQCGWLVGAGTSMLTISGAVAYLGPIYAWESQNNWLVPFTIAGLCIVGIGALHGIAACFWPIDQGTDNHICRPITCKEIPAVRCYVQEQLGPGMPTEQQLQALFDINSELFYVIESNPCRGMGPPAITGFFAIVPLKQGAVRRLEAGDLTGLAIQPEHVTKRRGTVRAFYIGSLVGSDLHSKAFAIKKVTTQLSLLCRKHGAAKIFARPITPDGVRLMRKHGFRDVEDKGQPRLNRVCSRLWS